MVKNILAYDFCRWHLAWKHLADDIWLMTLGRRHLADDKLVMTCGWWQLVDDIWLMTLGRWHLADDKLVMTCGWWQLVDDIWLVTFGWWHLADNIRLVLFVWNTVGQQAFGRGHFANSIQDICWQILADNMKPNDNWLKALGRWHLADYIWLMTFGWQTIGWQTFGIGHLTNCSQFMTFCWQLLADTIKPIDSWLKGIGQGHLADEILIDDIWLTGICEQVWPPTRRENPYLYKNIILK